MKIETIRMLITGISLFCAGMAALLMAAVTAFGSGREFLLKTYEDVYGGLVKSRSSLFDYRKTEAYLRKNGAVYHFGKKTGPIGYMMLRLLAGGCGMLLGTVWKLWAGLPAAILCYMLPDLLLVHCNNKDNERILPELKLVYHAISIQIRAGVHVTDALAECYASVRKGRLRDALLSLSGDIVMKADVEEALETFQGKFDNQYIDALCITVLQALESGQAVELLSDIGEQMKDMESFLMSRKKANLDRSITFYQLGILAAILVIVLYACVVHMASAVTGF